MTPVGPAGWEQRLYAVLGVPPERLTFEQIAQLEKRRVREADDLDFKSTLYVSTERSRGELAADVASFANHRGGLILLGIDEHDGAVAGLPLVSLSDEEERRMKQTLAGLVVPYIEVVIHRVQAPDDEARGVYALVIPPSSSRPHAVSRDKKLQYPRRDGTTRRWLSEAEVADLYGDRFRQADDAVSRVSRIVTETVASVADDAYQPRLCLGLVPTMSSEVAVDTARVRSITDWMAQFMDGELEGILQGTQPAVRAGLRRVRVFDNYDAQAPKWFYAELHNDGASGVSTAVGPLQNVRGEQSSSVLTWHLIRPAARSLNLAIRHAIENAGAYGDFLVEMQVTGPEPIALGAVRFGSLVEPIGPLTQLPLLSRHTFSADGLGHMDRQMLLGLTRILLTDIVHGLGVPEVVDLTSDGKLVRPDHYLRQWAESKGVPIVDS